MGRAIAIFAAMMAMLTAAHARSVSFDADDDDGLAVIGLSTGEDEEFDLVFARFVPETQKLDAGSFSGHTTVDHDAPKGELTYHVFKIDPGTHVFKSLDKSSFNQHLTLCLNRGTYAFDIRAGEAVYLGNFSAFGGIDDLLAKNPQLKGLKGLNIISGLSQLEPNLETAKAALARHPKVTVELKAAELRKTTFVNGHSLSGKDVCGGYY